MIISATLSGKVIWITGASSGIGAATAIKAAQFGAKVVLSARNADNLEAVKQKCLGECLS
jgi:NADP-dependent 3-hydroxy acid dehydrogenase YdfG